MINYDKLDKLIDKGIENHRPIAKKDESFIDVRPYLKQIIEHKDTEEKTKQNLQYYMNSPHYNNYLQYGS